MNRSCEKCGEELKENVAVCLNCGYMNNNVEKKDKKNSFFLVFGIILLFPIIIGCIFIGKNIYVKSIANSYVKKYIKPNLGSEYKNVNKIKYINREQCVTSYNTCAGDMGSGRKKVDGCYIYYYDIHLKDGMVTRAYIQDKNDQIYVNNDIEYSARAYEILNDFRKIYKKSSIKQIFETADDNVDGGIAGNSNNRKLIINIDESFKKSFNREVLDKIISLENSFSKNNKKIYFEFILNFNDLYVVEFNRTSSYYSSLNITKYYSEIEKYKTYGQHDFFIIDIDATDEEINWCIENSASFLDYENFIREKKRD